MKRQGTLDVWNGDGAWIRCPHGRRYSIQVTKMGCIIIRVKRCVKAAPVSAENYLRKEISKKQQTKTDGKLMDSFTLLHQLEHLSNIGTEGEGISQKAITTPKTLQW